MFYGALDIVHISIGRYVATFIVATVRMRILLQERVEQ